MNGKLYRATVYIFLSVRWCLETSSERDSYSWLAKYVIAKVFLILLLSCAYRKHIDITQVIRALEEVICMFERTFLGMFALLGPITRERTLDSVIRIQTPTQRIFSFLHGPSTLQTTDFYYRRINKRCSSSILKSSINALLTIVLLSLNVFSLRNKRGAESLYIFASSRESVY